MLTDIPPLIERPKTPIGVGMRELIILGAAGALALAALLLPAAFPLRIGLAVLLAGIGVGAALARDPQSGKPLEAQLADRLRFAGRERFWQRGAGANLAGEAGWGTAAEAERARPVPARRSRIVVQALPLTGGLWLSIFSLAVLAVLLSWIWLGGLQEISVWFGPGFGR